MTTPFSGNVRARALELKLTHNEVARRAGLHERRFANYVLGTREPDLQTLVRIAQVLQTTPNELLGVETLEAPTEVSLLRSRMAAALDQLDNRDMEIVVAQAEAMAALRSR